MIRSLTLAAVAATLLAADPWDAAMAAGFPDVQGATAWVGAWRGSPHGITDWAGTVGVREVHLRLADGRWLFHGVILHPAAPPEDVLEPLATPWDDPARDVRRKQDPVASCRNPALLALLRRAGVAAPAPEHLVPGAVLDVVRQAAVLAATAEDRRRLGSVLSALVPGQSVPDLGVLPDWSLHYDPTTRDLLIERFSLTPPGTRHPDGRGSSSSPPWQPREVPALVAALGDTGPSRSWTPDGRLATVGDQALAALAWMWGLDHDQLQGRDGEPLAPRLGRLVTQHGDLVAALAAEADLRPLLHQPRLLEALPEDRRTAAGRILAEDWGRLDAEGRQGLLANDDFGRALSLVADMPEVIQVINAWPAEGGFRALLACWRDRQGDPTALDALLAESLTATDLPGADDAWTWALQTPSTARFALVAQVVRLPVEHPQRQRVEGILSRGAFVQIHGLQPVQGQRWWGEDLMPAWWLVEEAAVIRRERPSPVLERLRSQNRSGEPGDERDRLALKAYLRGTPLPGQATPPALPAWWQAELAKAQGRPVLLELTATIGCWPCMAFHEAVAIRPAWRTWAAAHVHHITIDAGPSDPEAGKRLEELADLYGQKGVPRLLLLGADGVQRGKPLETLHDIPAFIAQVEARLKQP